MFEAVLKNQNNAELGTVIVEFPIPEDQYEQVILALEKVRSAMRGYRTVWWMMFKHQTALLWSE